MTSKTYYLIISDDKTVRVVKTLAVRKREVAVKIKLNFPTRGRP